MALAISAATVSACAAPVVLDDPPVDEATRQTCTSLVAALPTTVLGSARRETTGTLGGAWGNPPITVACGIAEPPGLTPTAECLEVDGVGWWQQPGRGGEVYTTIGRAAVVQVGVPSAYGEPTAALVELAPAVGAVPVVRPCV